MLILKMLDFMNAALFFILLFTLVISQGDLRWVFFCTIGNITCPERSTVNITQMYHAYSLECPVNRTEPITTFVGCYRPSTDRLLSVQQEICRLKQSCHIENVPGGEFIFGCPQAPKRIAIFEAFSYTCLFDSSDFDYMYKSMEPVIPPVSQNDESTTSKDEPTTGFTTQEVTVSTQISGRTTVATTTAVDAATDFTIPIVAGAAAGGAILLILLGVLIAVCRSRRIGTESIESPAKTPEPVSEINMVSNDGSTRVKTAPRIKQGPHKRVDIPLDIYVDNEQPYPNDDPRGLYALPNKTGQRNVKEADDTFVSVNKSGIYLENTEDSLNSALPEEQNTFVDVGSHYAEIDIANNGQMPVDSFTSGTGIRGSPDGDSQALEDIAPLRHEQHQSPTKRGDIVSVVYAEVNKTKPGANTHDQVHEGVDGDVSPSEHVYSN